MNNDPLKGLRGEAETITTLELENQSLARQNETLRNAQKACEDCDAPTLAEFRALTRRLEEAENNSAILQAKVDDQAEIIKFGSGECDRLNAKLTALRTAAEAAMKALELANVTDEKFNEKNADFIEAALAALRAVLGQAASNASNSPTASRDTQG